MIQPGRAEKRSAFRRMAFLHIVLSIRRITLRSSALRELFIFPVAL